MIRIPRISGPYGFDGFYLYWETQKLIEGQYFDWYINFFSFLGIYPFSSYPIGSLLILAPFILVFNDLELSILAYSIVLSSFAFLSSYLLGKELFNSSKYRVLFALFYVNNPVFLFFSYFTSTARLSLLVMVPIFLIYLLRFLEDRKVKDLLLTGGTYILLLFLHRLSFIYSFLLLIPLFYYVIPIQIKTRFEKLIYYKKYLIITLLAIFIYLIGIILLPSRNLGTKNPLPFSTGQFLFDTIIGDMIDALFNWGLLVFLLPFGLLVIVKTELYAEICSKNICKNLFWLFFPLIGIVTEPAFSRIILLPLVCLLSILGVFALTKISFGDIILILVSSFIVLFLNLYNIFWRGIDFYLPFVFILFFLVLLAIGLKKRLSFQFPQYKNHYVSSIVIITFVFFSLFVIDSKSSLVELKPVMPYMSDEEVLISNYLSQREKGTFAAYSDMLESRIAAKTGWLGLREFHSGPLMILNYYSKSEIESTSVLKSIFDWNDVYIFEWEGFTSEGLFRHLMWKTNTTTGLEIINNVNLRFLITRIESNNIEDDIYVSFSIFIQDLNNNYSCPFTTQNFCIWDLANLKQK